MLKKSLLTLAGIALAGVLFAPQAEAARDQIRIVGSSTVYPFSTAVAEEFGRSTQFRTPIVESTGSGGGLKLFCAGVGTEHPDITNSSRRIKASEIKNCAENGVEATEVKIGYDGIVLAHDRSGAPFALTLRQVYLALAKLVPNEEGEYVPNPYTHWNQIDPDLPAYKIEVLGPPPTSGTRDAFNELAMEGGCKTFDSAAAVKAENPDRYKALCRGIREDGYYIEAGENDNLIVQKLQANNRALGIFGFSFLDQNRDSMEPATINDISPTFETISSGEYPISRSMFFYVKIDHVDAIPGILEYVSEFTSERAAGDFGYLTDKGLIPLPPEELEEVRERALNLVPVTVEDLKHE